MCDFEHRHTVSERKGIETRRFHRWIANLIDFGHVWFRWNVVLRSFTGSDHVTVTSSCLESSTAWRWSVRLRQTFFCLVRTSDADNLHCKHSHDDVIFIGIGCCLYTERPTATNCYCLVRPRDADISLCTPSHDHVIVTSSLLESPIAYRRSVRFPRALFVCLVLVTPTFRIVDLLKMTSSWRHHYWNWMLLGNGASNFHELFLFDSYLWLAHFAL
jgi:hypothetical protein